MCITGYNYRVKLEGGSFPMKIKKKTTTSYPYTFLLFIVAKCPRMAGDSPRIWPYSYSPFVSQMT